MRHVAIIACDHGLGHVRRCYLLARELLNNGSKVDLYAPEEKVGRIRAVLGPADGLEAIDFATQTTPEGLQTAATGTLQWQDRLPDLDGYDLVISDTLPEILDRRPDAVLLAQFFWHDVLDGLPEGYLERCAILLHEIRPRIFGSELFAMPAVRNQPGFTPVGLFGSGQARPDLFAHRDALLVSPGSTSIARSAFHEFANMAADRDRTTFKTIYVDSAVMPAASSDWMRPTDYDLAVYQQALAVVCRPGLGVLTDALWHGAVPICLDAESNREMKHNAAVVSGERLGYRCESPSEVLDVLSSLSQAPCLYDDIGRLPTADFAAAAEVAMTLTAKSGHLGAT